MIIEEIKSIQSGKKDLRNFGALVGGVFAVLGFFTLYRHNPIGYLFLGLGAFLVFSGLCVPLILRPAHKIWMGLAILLGAVVTKIILTIFFFIGITLMSLCARLFKKRFLDVSYSKNIPTYWKKREVVKKEKADWAKQF